MECFEPKNGSLLSLGNWNGDVTFKLSFNKGGCIDFGQALLKAADMGMVCVICRPKFASLKFHVEKLAFLKFKVASVGFLLWILRCYSNCC